MTTRLAGLDRLRYWAVLLLTYLGLQGSLGLAWDIHWHIWVGRDTFWTPPHTLIYSSVFFSGLACLFMVLYETWQHRQGDPFALETTTTWLGRRFHATLGFIVAGCGNLGLLLAAPGDDYWHRLYGIDVTIWAPFHMMGLLSGLAVGLGVLYATFSLYSRTGRLSWLVPLQGAFLFVQLLTMIAPASNRVPLLRFGSLTVALYPVLFALILAMCLTLAARTVRWPAPALLWAAGVWGLVLLRDSFAAAGTSWLVGYLGLEYRRLAYSGPNSISMLIAVLAGALLFEVARWGLRRLAPRVPEAAVEAFAGLPAVVAACLLYWPWLRYVPGSHIMMPALLGALPAVLVLALLGSRIAGFIGRAVVTIRR